MRELLFNYINAHVELTHMLYRMPTAEELANRMGKDVSIIKGLRKNLEKMEINDVEDIYFEGLKRSVIVEKKAYNPDGNTILPSGSGTR